MVNIGMENEITNLTEVEVVPGEVVLDRANRIKAVLLLIIFLIPVALALYELVTQQVTGDVIEVVQPYLPQLDKIITF